MNSHRRNISAELAKEFQGFTIISVQGVLLTFGIIFTLLNILNAVIFSVGFEMLPNNIFNWSESKQSKEF
jgi:hypothetical protein